MNSKNKIRVLIILFSIKAGLHLLDGISAFSGGAMYGEYGDALVTAAIFAYLAYAINSTKNKGIYWAAVIFAGLVLLRSLLVAGFFLYSATSLPLSLILLGVLNGLMFGVAPLYILFNKEVRRAF